MCPRDFLPKPAIAPSKSRVVTVACAGSSCTDYSSFGNQQTTAGKSVLSLLVLLRMVAQYTPDIFLHENVLLFPLNLLKEVLDSLYSFEEAILQADHTGFPIERKRKYIIGRYRMKLTILCVELFHKYSIFFHGLWMFTNFQKNISDFC